MWGGEGRTEVIRGPNSKSPAVRFGRVLCQRCNNDRSQAFDLAYDKWSDALVRGMDDWWAAQDVSLETIYQTGWRTEAMNLARYYVKNFGCWLADKGIRPPQTLRDLLNGDEMMDEVELFLVKSESHYIGHRDYLREYGSNAALFRLPDLAWVSPSRRRVTGYQGTVLIGYVGVMMRWREGSGYRDSFFYHPHPVLHVLPAEPDFARRLKEIDQAQHE